VQATRIRTFSPLFKPSGFSRWLFSEWADIVLVMEKVHRNKASKKYKKLLKDKRVVVLDIPDIYECMQPELIGLLKAKVSKVVPL